MYPISFCRISIHWMILKSVGNKSSISFRLKIKLAQSQLNTLINAYSQTYIEPDVFYINIVVKDSCIYQMIHQNKFIKKLQVMTFICKILLTVKFCLKHNLHFVQHDYLIIRTLLRIIFNVILPDLKTIQFIQIFCNSTQISFFKLRPFYPHNFTSLNLKMYTYL